MVLLIVIVVIGAFVALPLLPRVKCTYKTALRALIAIGFFWLILMALGRWLFPGTYSPVDRAYQWAHGSVAVQVSLRLYYFFSSMAGFVAVIFLWVEYRFYRLSPNSQDRRHLLRDLVLVTIYLSCLIGFLQLW